jgi:hypothetical protein
LESGVNPTLSCPVQEKYRQKRYSITWWFVIPIINFIWRKFERILIKIKLLKWIQSNDWNQWHIVLRQFQSCQIWKWALKQKKQNHNKTQN